VVKVLVRIPVPESEVLSSNPGLGKSLKKWIINKLDIIKGTIRNKIR
jgi:hypothetical protein